MKTPADILTHLNVMVPMSDGVRLAVDVYLPSEAGHFPALLAVSPYGKNSMRPGTRLSQDNHPTVEHGHTEMLIEHGYAVVVGDLRGAGDSEGQFGSIKDPEDCHELIEWVAAQPWCDGNVGMMGISYFAKVQVPTAARRPPHLKAIMPFEPAAPDYYRDVAYHGGLFNKQFIKRFRHGFLAVERREPRSLQMLPPNELKEMVDHIRHRPEYEGDAEIQAVLDDPMLDGTMFDLLLHPEDDELYRMLSWEDQAEKIDIPCYLGMWGNVNVVDAFGAPRIFSKLGSRRKKLIIGPPVWPDRPYWQFGDEIRRWYGRWLKGEENGIEDEAPVRIFVTGENKWRSASDYPLPDTRWTPFYLHGDGWFHEYPPTESSDGTDFRYEPSRHASAFFESSVLVEDTEIIGPIAAYLHASSSVDDASWVVSLYDVFPDGRKFFLTRGWLKASHRALDAARSTPWRPYHTHRKPTPIQPGAVEEYAIEVMPIAHMFRAGHRLGIEISGDEHSLVDGGRGWLASLLPTERELIDELMFQRFHTPHAMDRRPKTLTVHHGADYPSYVLLPVTGGNVVGTSTFMRIQDRRPPEWLS
jgi:predicted acyl esterase